LSGQLPLPLRRTPDDAALAAMPNWSFSKIVSSEFSLWWRNSEIEPSSSIHFERGVTMGIQAGNHTSSFVLYLGTGALAVVLAACGSGGTPTPAQAGSGNVALTVPKDASVGGFNYTQGSYLEGFQFTANQAITITQLGAYDSNLCGLPNGGESFATAPVAVYDLTTHALLGTVNVSASDPATGVYRYAALSTPVTLNTTDTYAVVWVSLTNHYIASPTLVASDVNPAINYLAMAGHGPGGLTMTSTMVEPDWSFSIADHGLSALNYDLGPNFIFEN